jgi:hypothetical protein
MQGGSCLLRIDFPDVPPDENLEPISWDDWFRIFDERNLALLVEDRTASGQISYFNKLVDRDAAVAKLKGSSVRGRSATNVRSISGSRAQTKATRGSTRGARTATARGQHRHAA